MLLHVSGRCTRNGGCVAKSAGTEPAANYTDVTPGSLVVSSAFNSLLFLATGCPKLVTLRIATDSIDVPDAASWPEMHHGLKYLDLRLKDEQFPRSSVLPMAHLLDRIFQP